MSAATPPHHNPDRLWRGLIVKYDDDSPTDVGWTCCWTSRSLATEAGYLYAMANHLEMFRVHTFPFEGDREQIGTFSRASFETDVYLGFDNDGDPIDHSANCLQYDSMLNFQIATNNND